MVKIKNKNRLYLAVSGTRLTDPTPRYIWSFLVGPKIEDKSINPGTHITIAKDDQGQWRCVSTQTQSVQSVPGILARVLFAKIEDNERLNGLLQETPAVSGAGNEITNSSASRHWAEGVLTRLAKDGKIVGTSQLEWEKVHVTARAYVAKKIAENRYREEEKMVLPTPTWDMLSAMEMAP